MAAKNRTLLREIEQLKAGELYDYTWKEIPDLNFHFVSAVPAPHPSRPDLEYDSMLIKPWEPHLRDIEPNSYFIMNLKRDLGEELKEMYFSGVGPHPDVTTFEIGFYGTIDGIEEAKRMIRERVGQ